MPQQNESALPGLGEQHQQLLLFFMRELQQFLDANVAAEDSEAQHHWQLLFGKESALGAYAKLVSLHKPLAEWTKLHSAAAPAADTPDTPLSDEDWALLALCVDRWRGRE